MVWTQAARLLELALLDRSSAQELLLEAVHGNAAADDAVRRDWAPSEGAWMERYGGKAPRGRSSKCSFCYNYYIMIIHFVPISFLSLEMFDIFLFLKGLFSCCILMAWYLKVSSAFSRIEIDARCFRPKPKKKVL